MKNYILIAAIITLTFVSCKKSETKVGTSENPSGTITTTTIETDKSAGFDSTKINATVDKAKEKLEVAGEKIDEAADKEGEKLKKAGEDVKEDLQKK